MRFLVCLCLLFSSIAQAQIWQAMPIADLPEPVANNAVCGAKVQNRNYMYSFGGIDTTKVYSGIHLKSYKYNVDTDSWITLADLPDTLGKIAAAASNVKGRIYIIGGYHVYQNSSELSSRKVHVFDPITDNYLPDAQDIPIAIDDQVQCVWRDSLIYVISGWSNTANVTAVQIYNPSQDNWTVGTSLPNNADFAVFGSQGIIKGDTIFYYGGARMGLNFPCTDLLRIGIIDSANPSSINWLSPISNTNQYVYRGIVLNNPDNSVSIIGGSQASYNFNGLAYNNNLGVNPVNEQYKYDIANQVFTIDSSQVISMDLRGHAYGEGGVGFICGGMTMNQQVTAKAFKLEYVKPNGLNGIDENERFKIFPNPAINKIFVTDVGSDYPVIFQIQNTLGQSLNTGVLTSKNNSIDISQLSHGMYYLSLQVKGLIYTSRVVKVKK